MVEHKKRGIHKKPCYVKGQDLLVPTTVSESPANTRFVNVSLKVPLKYLITFGGGINKTHLTNPDLPEIDAGYSFGVRQTFARLYHRHPEIKIFWGFTADFWLEAAASEFCFAPAGWGWGSRVKGGITSGCIPVIVQVGAACRTAEPRASGTACGLRRRWRNHAAACVHRRRPATGWCRRTGKACVTPPRLASKKSAHH
eukprot:361740-Chlamydomonas_euryale.AAC.6